MKRYLIAAGTSQYPHDPNPEDAELPGVEDDLTKIVDLFCNTLESPYQYERALPKLGMNPSSREVLKLLGAWFLADDRAESDIVVVYYAGHGSAKGGKHYLLTADSDGKNLVGSAVATETLADMLKDTPVHYVLFLIDTCHSGQGAGEMAAVAKDHVQSLVGGQFNVASIAAARAKEWSKDGIFVDALEKVLKEGDEKYAGRVPEYLPTEWVVGEINRHFDEHFEKTKSLKETAENYKQHAEVNLSGGGIGPFFRNPRFVKGAEGLDLETQKRIVKEEDLDEHWGPRARGVEFDTQPGWYFEGRTAILRQLAGWLSRPFKKPNLYVVTGSPGSGKSAVLARLVTLADPDLRQKAPLEGVDPATLPEPQSIQAAIHARKQTAEYVVRYLAGICGLETASLPELKEHLRREEQTPFHIVLDALDEANEPEEIVRRVLAPLAQVPAVRILVGSRYAEKRLGTAGQPPSYRFSAGLQQYGAVLDLDEEPFFDAEDVIRYVKHRLLASAEPDLDTPYRDQAELAQSVAGVVTRKAGRVFLIARLICRSLIQADRPVDPNQEAWQENLPTTIAGAFDDELERLGTEKYRARDLLTPLAYAQGAGLPWDNLWAPLASALANRAYCDRDVAWLREQAGAYIIEALEGGRSVYRLYHQALADYLCQERDSEQSHRVIALTLIDSVPPLADGGGKDWRLASPYVRTHLAEHAAGGGVLAELVNDPLYLLCADPGRLLSVLATHGGAVPRGVLHVYKSIVRHVREKSIGEAASYLRMSAHQRGLGMLADHPSLLPLPRKWDVAWAQWRTETPSRVFGKGDAEISALVVATWVARPVAVLGRRDGAVEVWDVADGTRLIPPWKPGGAENVWHVAFVEVQDGPLLVSSWSSGHLGVLNLTTSESAVRVLNGPEEYIEALCVAIRDEEHVCVTAHEDLRMAVWRLPTLEVVFDRPAATDASIYCLREVQRGEALLLSGGDGVLRDEDGLTESKLRLWSLNGLGQVWGDSRREDGVIKSMEIGECFGRKVVVASQDGWEPPEVWDLESGRRLFRDEVAAMHAWIHSSHGEVLLISVNAWKKLRVLRLERSMIGNELALTGTLAHESVPIIGKRFSGIFELHGRAVLMSSVRDRVRVWDVEELLTDTTSPGGQEAASCSVFSLVANPSEHTLYCGTTNGIDTRDARSGALVEGSAEGGIRRDGNIVESLMLSANQDRLIAGTYDGCIHVYDVHHIGAPLSSIQAGDHVVAVSSAVLRGHTLVFASVMSIVESYRVWAIRVWDLESGEEVPTGSHMNNQHYAYQLPHGQQDKQMLGLAVASFNDKIRIAFASKYGQVMVGELSCGKSGVSANWHHAWRAYQVWGVPHTTGEYINCLTQNVFAGERLLAAGTEFGHLAIWDFLSGEVISSRASTHVGGVNALCFHEFDGSGVLISGGADGVLRFWSMDLRPLYRIDIDAPIYAITRAGGNQVAVGTSQGALMLDIGSQASVWLL